jgi:hypothetical protein
MQSIEPPKALDIFQLWMERRKKKKRREIKEAVENKTSNIQILNWPRK